MPNRLKYAVLPDLRRELEEARRAGVDFDSAWDAALRSIPWPGDGETRRWWREALAETREEWARAYRGEPSPVGDVVLALVDGLEPGPASAEERRVGVIA